MTAVRPVDRRWFCGDLVPHSAHNYRCFAGGHNTETLACDGAAVVTAPQETADGEASDVA